METIEINCTTGAGLELSLDKFYIYPGNAKKHSQLEIERLCESILKDGFLFPIAVGKVKDKNYVIDGECRLFALQELECRGYEIPPIPVFYIRSNEKTIIRNILMGTSTNHCVTKSSLEKICQNQSLLKELAFNEGELIDFFTNSDIEKFFEKTSDVVKIASAKEYSEGIKGDLL